MLSIQFYKESRTFSFCFFLKKEKYLAIFFSILFRRKKKSKLQKEEFMVPAVNKTFFQLYYEKQLTVKTISNYKVRSVKVNRNLKKGLTAQYCNNAQSLHI